MNPFNPITEKAAWLYTETRNIIVYEKSLAVTKALVQKNALKYGVSFSDKKFEHLFRELKTQGFIDFDGDHIESIEFDALKDLSFRDFRKLSEVKQTLKQY